MTKTKEIVSVKHGLFKKSLFKGFSLGNFNAVWKKNLNNTGLNKLTTYKLFIFKGFKNNVFQKKKYYFCINIISTINKILCRNY